MVAAFFDADAPNSLAMQLWFLLSEGKATEVASTDERGAQSMGGRVGFAWRCKCLK